MHAMSKHEAAHCNLEPDCQLAFTAEQNEPRLTAAGPVGRARGRACRFRPSRPASREELADDGGPVYLQGDHPSPVPFLATTAAPIIDSVTI
jgi:hypothetical protein